MSLTLMLVASDETDFFKKYKSFCTDVLEKGFLTIQTSFEPDVYYHFEYNSCSQFTQFIRQMAKFSLKLTEPNPNDRSA